MTQATRIDNDEAKNLYLKYKLTANHVMVMHQQGGGMVRFCAKIREGSDYRFWFSDGNWLVYDTFADLVDMGLAHVELETPSPFDDEAFKGWNALEDSRAIKTNTGTYQIYESGEVWFSGRLLSSVPLDRIPEAARLINALLALGDGK